MQFLHFGRTDLWRLIAWKKMDYLCNCESEISNVCNAVEGHRFQATKIVRHYANDRFELVAFWAPER